MTWRFLCAMLLVALFALGFTMNRTAGRAAPIGHDLAYRAMQSLPPRDLYALTDQLKLRPPRPISHVVRRTTPNYPVGRQDHFFVLGTDRSKYFTVQATIRAKSPHLYIYVQNGIPVNGAAAKSAADYFERSIYPTDRAFFGSEWRPGVDHDAHITCLVANLHSSDAAGFYSSEDEYPRVVNRWSNQREMIYINSLSTVPGERAFRLYLSHEFQHMIHWNMHPRDNAWLNEGMSMMAEYVNHFPPKGEAYSFTDAPTTQLNAWSLGAAAIPHYGAAYLYLQYLFDRYGRGLIKDIVADKARTDFETINYALQQRHIHRTARQIFTDWVVANWVNDRSVSRGQYGYKDAPYRITHSESRTPSFASHWSIPPWAAHYVTIDNLQKQKPFQLTFSAPTTVPLVGFDHASNAWWSNRGDMAQTQLQRTVDLRKVHTATLHFRTTYDAEKNYDYAFVEASRDGGKTWDTLQGTHTTTSNPNGGNFGNGYTGNSKRWLNESVNLSRYTGRRVELRFQYVTDDEYNGTGMVVSNINIPEIHFGDDVSGWRPRGFIYINANTLLNAWTVQLISYTDRGTTVRTLPLSSGHGSITIDPSKSGLRKLVVVTFSTAPKTTVNSEYNLSATPSG